MHETVVATKYFWQW